jgi:hypothetical protein
LLLLEEADDLSCRLVKNPSRGYPKLLTRGHQSCSVLDVSYKCTLAVETMSTLAVETMSILAVLETMYLFNYSSDCILFQFRNDDWILTNILV